MKTVAVAERAVAEKALIEKDPAEKHQIPVAEPDLIDRIAAALPEDVRAGYYRELIHCRSLPESDEMLRLLRAMQFLVLLIEQAPSRVAEERERLDKLLVTALGNMSKISAASETWHMALQRKLDTLPTEVAAGISPAAVASQINESLRQEFLRSTIPKTAEQLNGVAAEMRTACIEFSKNADSLGKDYRGAAKDAQKAVAALKLEITGAAEAAAHFTSEVALTFSRAYRWMLFMVAGGAIVIGIALGMVFERASISRQQTVTVPVVAPAVQHEPTAVHAP